jgi:hypothetical protein
LVRIGQDQLEASLRPIIAITVIGGNVVIKNCGPGPALNLAWKSYSDRCVAKDESRSIFPVNDSASVGSLENLAFTQMGDDEWKSSVDYESVSGQKYRTTATWEKTKGAKIHLRSKN